MSCRKFLRAVDSGNISRLVIFHDRIVGEFKQEADFSEQALTHAPAAPWRIRIQAIEKQVARQFIVNRLSEMPDPDLLDRLEKSDIDFEGQFESNALRSPVMGIHFPPYGKRKSHARPGKKQGEDRGRTA